MSHHHSHEAKHPEAADEQLSMQDKLVKMIEFWMHHNREHAHSYRDWASRARGLGLQEVALILEGLAEEAVLPNCSLEYILSLLEA